jgi:pyruvate dehydrogenase (quinone)
MERWRQLLKERGTRPDKPMKPQVVTYHLDKFLKDDAIIACDTGTVTTWGARYITMRDGMKFAASGMLATMANALPYSIGAAVAYPGRQVVCLAGDGGFTMLMGEMATLVKYNLPVKIIIIKNNSLGEIKWEQIVLEGNPEFGVDLYPIDFAKYAEACGAHGFSVKDPNRCGDALDQFLNVPGPAVLEAVVDPLTAPMPGKIKAQQAFRFAESLARGEPDAITIAKEAFKDRVREMV